MLYLLLFVIGLILPPVFGLLPRNGPDNILHLVSVAVALAIGLASPTTVPSGPFAWSQFDYDRSTAV